MINYAIFIPTNPRMLTFDNTFIRMYSKKNNQTLFLKHNDVLFFTQLELNCFSEKNSKKEYPRSTGLATSIDINVGGKVEHYRNVHGKRFSKTAKDIIIKTTPRSDERYWLPIQKTVQEMRTISNDGSFGLSQRLERKARSRVIKKAIAETTALEKEYKMNYTQAKQEIKKFVNVLQDVKGQGRGYIARCPNKEFHSKNDNKRSFAIAIVKTEEQNKEKFGEYMITFCCYANGNHECTNTTLAKKFKQLDPTIKLGRINTKKKKIEGHLFPTGDESWKEVNDLGTRSDNDVGIFKNIHGHTWCINWKNYNRTKKKNDYFPLCYSRLAGQGLHPRYDDKGEIDGGWVEEQLFEEDRPFYRIDELTKSPLRKIAIFEGWGVVNKAKTMEEFKDYFCTTWVGGASTWYKTNWKGLEKFDEIISIGDNDLVGQRASKELVLYLRNVLGYKNAKMSIVPNWLPKGWDAKDDVPEGFNLRDLVENTCIPKEKVVNDYTTLEADIVQNRWSHLKNSRKFYWDHFLKTREHKENLDNWYEADRNVKRGSKSPTKFMHANQIDIAEGLAYIPSDQKDIWRNGLRYINAYRPYEPIKLTQDEINNISVEAPLRQLKILTNFDEEDYRYLCDTIATLIQTPWVNIKYATVFISVSQGTGKNYVLTLIHKMVGGQNAVPLETEQITKPLGRSWLQDKHVVTCAEYEVVGSKAEVARQINTTKTLVTDEMHSCEPKGVDPFTIHNHFTLFLATNQNKQVILEDIKTRRWSVLECMRTREQILDEFPNHFDEMEKFVNDEKCVSRLHHYFKHEYKISEGYISWHARITDAKRRAVRNLTSQLHKNLDEYRWSKKSPFKKDASHTRAVYEELRLESTGLFKDLDENSYREYVEKSEECDWAGTNGGAVQLTDEDFKKYKRGTRQWAITNNLKLWNENIKRYGYHYLRLHLQGKFDIVDFKKGKQEELYDTDDVSSTQQPTKGKGYGTGTK